MVVSEDILKRREYHRQWERSHKDRTKLYHIRKYAKNKDRLKAKRSTPKYKAKMREYQKAYRSANRVKIKALNRNWVQENKGQVAKYRKDYKPRRIAIYHSRKKEILARKKELSKTFKYRNRVREYNRRRRREDSLFALHGSLRASMNRAFRRQWIKKPARTEELMGCTISEAKAHIESQFEFGMSWSNRSSFVVDHWVPIIAFDLRDVEERKLAFNWRNLRPMTRHDNAEKSDTLPNPLPDFIPPHIAARILTRSQQPPKQTPSAPISAAPSPHATIAPSGDSPTPYHHA